MGVWPVAAVLVGAAGAVAIPGTSGIVMIPGAPLDARASHSGRSVLTVNRIATQIVQTCANTSHNRFNIVMVLPVKGVAKNHVCQ